MKNPIKTIGLFATPESMEALQSQIRGPDMNIALGLTWNYLSAQLDKVLTESEPEPWFTSHWDEHPEHRVTEWQYEVDNGDTRQGYHDWVTSQIEQINQN